MLLISRLASHRMFKISTIHQHTSFKSNSRCVARYAYARSAICNSMVALGRHLFKQLRDNVIQSKCFRPLPGNSLITPCSPLRIIRYKILINALNSSVIIISEAFYEIVRVYSRKSSDNNYKQYQIGYSKLVK